MTNIAKFLASAAGLVFVSGGALAAPAANAPATPAPASEQAEVENAMLYLKVLISGLQSDQVEEPMKGALVGCLYNNSLGKISESMDKAIADNSDTIRRDNPSELLSAMLQICGYTPEAGQSKPAPKGR